MAKQQAIQRLINITGVCALMLLLLPLPSAPLSGTSPDWLPGELKYLENKLWELSVQLETLENYAPEKFPDFPTLEKANQHMEQLDFSRRKFDLLVEQYNLTVDKVFPKYISVAKLRPNLSDRLAARIRDYDANGSRSLPEIQENINRTALQIERLEKKIERLQTVAAKKTSPLTSVRGGNENTPISLRIRTLEEDRDITLTQITIEETKLSRLKEKETRESLKISEKQKEIIHLQEKASAAADPLERFISDISAKVLEIRLNGLEIPRLNTSKTFVFLSQTTAENLRNKAEELSRDILSLEKRSRRELRDKVIRALFVVSLAAAIVLIFLWLARRIARRLVERVLQSDKLDAHRKQRFQTLSSVSVSFIKITVWTLAVLWVFGETNIDYKPFLVAAGGISLAVGFGAQSLVKDVVTGFFLLMEEQFALGDVVEIDGKMGVVEKISLRTIKFRALDGTLHILPNGAISAVSNKTFQWSRAIVPVNVSYQEEPGRILKIMKTLCAEIYADPEWNAKLMEEPEPQGIISFGQSAIEFRVMAKTLPGAQWEVGRALSIRIKNAFDREGVEIPFNYLNVIHRTEKIKKNTAPPGDDPDAIRITMDSSRG